MRSIPRQTPYPSPLEAPLAPDPLSRAAIIKALRDPFTGRALRLSLEKVAPGVDVGDLDEEEVADLLLRHGGPGGQPKSGGAPGPEMVAQPIAAPGIHSTVSHVLFGGDSKPHVILGSTIGTEEASKKAVAGAGGSAAPAPATTKPVSGPKAGDVAKPGAAPVTVLVTPELKVEYKVVLLDRGLSKHQAGAEPKIQADPTYVLLSLKQDKPDPKFTQGALLKAAPANVEAYEDEKLTKKIDLSKAIPGAKLAGAGFKVWLKGVTKGAFDLKLEVEPPSDGRFKAAAPATEKMGVVEIQMKIHEHDVEEIKKKKVDPDQDPITKYYDALKALALPDPKEMTDERKVKNGGLLHVQKDGHFGRAKVIVKKLDAAQWPAGTDDYKVILGAADAADSSKVSGNLGLFDAETGGAAKWAPVSLKVTDLKAADVTLWVEGKAASKKALDAMLYAGIDRGAAPPEKKPKRCGDWCRFTVVEIKEVKIEASATAGKAVVWDSGKKRFYINTDADAAGRELKDKSGKGKKIKISATLTEKIEKVPVHFMLSGHKDNVDAAKWTTNFSWPKLDAKLKPIDRKDRKDFLHVAAETGADGVAATTELVLSRLGGEKYRIGAYLPQDPHLAKYVADHADLGKRKPVLSDEFEIWRRVWVQISINKASALVSRSKTETGFEKTFLEYKEVDEVKFDKGTVAGLVEHEKWHFVTGGGTTKVICVGGHNSTKFHGLFKAPTDDHKPKSHMILCDVQFDPDTSRVNTWDSSKNPAVGNCWNSSASATLAVVKPPLKGGALVVTGQWTWNDGTTEHKGPIADADVSTDSARAHYSEFKVKLPATCPATCVCGGGTAIAVSAAKKAKIKVQLNAAAGPYAGESGSPHCLIVIDPDDKALNNTILHEVGHQFAQVRATKSWLGVPDHPDQYVKRGGVGSHCKKSATEHATAKDEDGNKQYTGGTCVMYHVAVGNVLFCDNCKTDLRARDLSAFGKTT